MRGRIVLVGLGLGLALAGCGNNATASSNVGAVASATATCPPARTFKTVTGTISATGSNTITVTNSAGTQVVVQLGSNVRITKAVSVAPTGIATGTSVLIVADTNATTAQRISVLSSSSAGGFGSGGGFGRFGGGSGTPGAGRNPACFTRTPGTGRGGAAGAFQGLRGTVDSVSGSQIVIDDTQGQTFSLAINSSTVITSTASGTVADLVTGAKVLATGTASGSQIQAATIAVQAP